MTANRTADRHEGAFIGLRIVANSRNILNQLAMAYLRLNLLSLDRLRFG
jgi:hypothetical protein